MAASPPKAEADQPEEKKKKGPGIVMWLLVAAISAGSGFAAPLLMSSSGSHGAEKQEDEHETPQTAQKKTAKVDYGQAVANLNEPRLNCFLRTKINLLVDAKDEKLVTDLVAQEYLVLHSWLLGHLSEKSFEDIRGEAGQKMLQREILEKFNSMLFTDGYDRVLDVLFEEFITQQ